MNRPLHGGNLAWAAALAGCSPDAILDFSASINPLGPPESAIAAIQRHLKDLKAYPDPDYHQLRASLSEVHQVPSEWILPGNGSAELLTWACWDLSELDRTFLVTPAFGDYWRALKAFNARVQKCPLLSPEETFLSLESDNWEKEIRSADASVGPHRNRERSKSSASPKMLATTTSEKRHRRWSTNPSGSVRPI